MIAIYATTLLILVASYVLGRALLTLLRWPSPAYLAGAVGFALLVTISPFLIRLPGRALTAAIVLGALVAAAALILVSLSTGSNRGRGRDVRPPSRHVGGEGPRESGTAGTGLGGGMSRPRLHQPRLALAVAIAAPLAVIAAASLPFLFQDHVGILGEGIYTNDHAAQLYWADWLQTGFGPEPSAVRFGYPIGPQAVAAIAAEVTGTSLVSAFNGLLLAIPALTALAALGALADVPPLRRGIIAALCGLPYLAASFLAQSAFKETAMALFVLAFAVTLWVLGATREPGEAGPRLRSAGVVVLVLAAGSVFTFSIPGLAWFAIAIPLWLAAEAVAGRGPIDLGRARDALAGHRVALAAALVALAAVVAVAFGPAQEFIEKIDDVQESAGRLSSPVFPGEALGIWPQGDFRIVRGDVSGAIPAVAFGALAITIGGLTLLRRRELALLVTLAAGVVVYLGARVYAEIHVEAKALAVISPLAALVALRGLLAPPPTLARYTVGAVTAIALAASTFLALRATPVGFDDRAGGLERLGERIEGRSVVFLGVDRFAAYRLRGTLARAPAGYVPQEIAARPEKVWQQGQAVDFDTLEPAKLDKFDFAITTTAAHQSLAPPNFEPLAQSGGYVLWRRDGETPRSRVAGGEDGGVGAPLDCAPRLSAREGEAIVLTGGDSVDYREWDLPALVDDAAGGQERTFAAPGQASVKIPVPGPERYELSLQYHSQAPLEVLAGGELVAELPPSLDGMYLDGAGRGAFWPAGEVAHRDPDQIEVTIRAMEPSELQDVLGVEHRVWLGDVAATPARSRAVTPLREACGLSVDHFALERR